MGKFSFSKLINQTSAEDRADYENGAGADDLAKAGKDAEITSTHIQAQRQANRAWGRPPKSQGDDIEKRNAK